MMFSVVRNARESQRAQSRNIFPDVDEAADRRPAAGARKRQGATVVEVAIVAPIVFAIILGIIELGRGLMVVHLLNNAAQAGARTGIIEGKSTASIKSVVVSALTSCGISGETATVQVNDGSTDASAAVAGDEITVLVKVPINSISWVPVPKFLTGNLQGQYTMRRE